MFANYLRSKGAKRVDEFVFMPHEDKPVISLEDQLMSMTKS